MLINVNMGIDEPRSGNGELGKLISAITNKWKSHFDSGKLRIAGIQMAAVKPGGRYPFLHGVPQCLLKLSMSAAKIVMSIVIEVAAGGHE